MYLVDNYSGYKGMSPAPKPDDLLRNPEAHLPLTNLAYHVLIALAGAPRHGYGIIKDIEERTGGAMQLRSGTLYTAIQRLQADGLLQRAGSPDSESDPRRRYFTLTDLGQQVARLETQRLTAMIGTARERGVG